MDEREIETEEGREERGEERHRGLGWEGSVCLIGRWVEGEEEEEVESEKPLIPPPPPGD